MGIETNPFEWENPLLGGRNVSTYIGFRYKPINQTRPRASLTSPPSDSRPQPDPFFTHSEASLTILPSEKKRKKQLHGMDGCCGCVIMKARNGFGIENTELTGWVEGKGREGVGFCGV